MGKATATFIRNVSQDEDWTMATSAYLYRLDPPIDGRDTDYYVVSHEGVYDDDDDYAPQRLGTIMWPADSDGTCLGWHPIYKLNEVVAPVDFLERFGFSMNWLGDADDEKPAPLLKETDPELEALLDEEEEIARRWEASRLANDVIKAEVLNAINTLVSLVEARLSRANDTLLNMVDVEYDREDHLRSKAEGVRLAAEYLRDEMTWYIDMFTESKK